jgi:ABC-2 type transport system permease protein
MNLLLSTTRLGLERGWIEFKQYLRNPQEMIWTVIMSGIFLAVIWFQRDTKIEGISLALLTLPSLLGMSIANGGFVGAAGALSYDREDGTLLRAKAIPQGMTAYLASRVVYVTLTTVLSILVVLIPGLFLIDGLAGIGLDGVAVFVWIFLLGLLATAPWGAIVGSLVKSSGSGFGLTFLPMIGLVAISGIFYPITALAGWLQALAQVFPVYWLGLGARSVFLPDAAVAAEIGGSWRPIETTAMLVVWAVVGLLITPRILRRMAQRTSGSDMQARKEQMMQRGY